jgi:hypothetical protein
MGLDMYLYEKEVNQVAYWRKANAIHNWFITEAEVTDNCEPISLSRETLIKLRDTCTQVYELHTVEAAMEFLPPVGGFFFGTTEIDDWYWQNVKETEEALTVIINQSTEDQMYEYWASW